MPKPLPITCDVIQFLLTRSDPFLVRYASLVQPHAWRQRVREEQLPNWLAREAQGDATLEPELIEFITLTFGAGRLPMLRRRYSSHRHRAGRDKRSVDLDADALAALERIRAQYRLDSYSETILWLTNEVERVATD
ncbi:hypothetical protein [Ferrimonas balearica]|uniref:hypothetical protein n=1 Tax=Ferrimonas balearica TaxID=44012 RepID=UPI001C99445F|nr:hypothetical protein [Ferrimonas balearica]MBY5991598.1 hypothetical protein [Ferrimonas balearica]